MSDHPIRVNNKVYNKGRKTSFATQILQVLERPTPGGVTIILFGDDGKGQDI
jgi:hypothetical protein